MSDKEGVMAAIMVAIDQLMEEEARVVPGPRYEFSFWKYAGLEEMMRMRTLCQMRIGKSASRLAHLRRRR